MRTFIANILSLFRRPHWTENDEETETWHNLPGDPPEETYERLWASSKGKC